ncbi:sensor histidine kinase [Mucilaginibacter arboris]|uniref:sensor histidine kinase n=1 Tax=Mucilaginibacter arboris TaxID=2682090 RepID=UPI001E2EB7E5|nr:histidine kinase [Mucilaginibacter arboris]
MENQPSLFNKFRFIVGAGLLAWFALQSYLLYDFGFSWKVASTDAGTTSVLLAAACYLISNNLKYYQPEKGRSVFILVLCLVLTFLWIVACRWLLPQLIPEPAYKSFLIQSLTIRFSIAFLIITCMAMLSALRYMQKDQKANEARKLAAETLARDAELYKLRQQLQPHFLFNSLNSISALIGFKPDEARKMIHQLSDFLRGTLKEEQQWVTLQHELQHLQLYLDIEKVRFGHRLTTILRHNDTADAMLIPPMLLQPLVENAIKFGLYDTIGDVTISLDAVVISNQLQITISNPYDPETAYPKHGTGFGLSGVKRRLYLLFARHDLIEIQTRNSIFSITLKIPQTVNPQNTDLKPNA